tara:strand:- start:107 stop:607 length:501 start_codon:yes stop_codon:yes gene_type:complete
MNKKFIYLIVFFISIFLLKNLNAEDKIIKGKAKVVNSDYIKIDKQTIILFGVEAMERPQKCYINNELWPCWESGVRKLEEIVDLGETVCFVKGKAKMNRVFAICETQNIELNKELIRSGLALARIKQSDLYIDDQRYAQENNLGIWRGKFIEPWKWRMQNFIPDDP